MSESDHGAAAFAFAAAAAIKVRILKKQVDTLLVKFALAKAFLATNKRLLLDTLLDARL